MVFTMCATCGMFLRHTTAAAASEPATSSASQILVQLERSRSGAAENTAVRPSAQIPTIRASVALREKLSASIATAPHFATLRIRCHVGVLLFGANDARKRTAANNPKSFGSLNVENGRNRFTTDTENALGSSPNALAA